MNCFRVDYCGRGELADRQQKLNQFLSKLAHMAEGTLSCLSLHTCIGLKKKLEFNVCVLMVCIAVTTTLVPLSNTRTRQTKSRATPARWLLPAPTAVSLLVVTSWPTLQQLGYCCVKDVERNVWRRSKILPVSTTNVYAYGMLTSMGGQIVRSAKLRISSLMAVSMIRRRRRGKTGQGVAGELLLSTDLMASACRKEWSLLIYSIITLVHHN